jgi:hypothetical protein
LDPNAGSGQLAQLVLHERQQLGSGPRVARLDGGQNLHHVAHVAEHTPGWLVQRS